MEDKLVNAYNQEIDLTQEQQACLKYVGNKTLMIKGYAGAGKSIVLMAIAQKYIEMYKGNFQNKVAFFTFQNTLVTSTKEVLDANGEICKEIMVSTVDSYAKKLYDSLVENKQAPKIKMPFSHKKDGDKEIRLNNVTKAISAHHSKYGAHRFHKVDPEFWLDEFDWMKSMNVWTDDLDYYLSIPRKGRGGTIRMSSSDRVTAYQLFTCYCDHLSKTGQGDWADTKLYLNRNPELITDDMKYQHILIDEAQDLSLAQMVFLMNLYKKDMHVALDMNQQIHGQHWTPKLLGIETTTKKLTKSMRTTKQIDALAESVRQKNDAKLDKDDISLRAIPEREGPLPQIVHLEDVTAERKYVVAYIKKFLAANPKATIAIVASKNNQFKYYADWLASEDIMHEQIKKDATFSAVQPGVKIVTAYSAKGLEFSGVIIPSFIEGNFPYSFSSDDPDEMEQFLIKMRNLAYVAMTRARGSLLITFSGKKGSRFLADMKPDLFQAVGDPLDYVCNTKAESFQIESVKYSDAEAKPGSSEFVPQKIGTAKASECHESDTQDLVSFLKSKELDPIDKRPSGGALWVAGGKVIKPALDESRKKFGAYWIYSEAGGKATGHKAGWFTKCDK